MGDYFDCFPSQNRTGDHEWLEELMRVWRELGDRATWLVGNHELHYLEAYKKLPAGDSPAKLYYTCRGFDPERAAIIKDRADPAWLFNLELCVGVDRWIVSHAGFHLDVLPYLKSGNPRDAVLNLYKKWHQDVECFMFLSDHWIGRVGPRRSGRFVGVGSPVWLDWEAEFEPIPDLPQIVGHAQLHPDRVLGSRMFEEKVGDNYCIDIGQTGYATIEKGVLTWHELV
jgi:hypothetical protein